MTSYSTAGPRPQIVLISNDPGYAVLIGELGRIAECEVLPSLEAVPQEPEGWPPDCADLDALFVDFHSEMEMSQRQVTELLRYSNRTGTRLVVTVRLEQLDLVYGLFPPERTHFVIGREPAELLIALNLAARGRSMESVFETRSDAASETLSSISSSLSEFARALSRIAAAEAEADGAIAPDHLADKARGYRHGAPPAPMVGSGSDADIDPAEIRELIRLRRLRDRFFEPDLFADPAWDILLDLMAARLEGQKVSVSSLCIAAAVPATTALRWIKSMTDTGYLERRSDPTDARRVYIQLSEEAAAKMADYVRLRLAALAR